MAYDFFDEVDGASNAHEVSAVMEAAQNAMASSEDCCEDCECDPCECEDDMDDEDDEDDDSDHDEDDEDDDSDY